MCICILLNIIETKELSPQEKDAVLWNTCAKCAKFHNYSIVIAVGGGFWDILKIQCYFDTSQNPLKNCTTNHR